MGAIVTKGIGPTPAIRRRGVSFHSFTHAASVGHGTLRGAKTSLVIIGRTATGRVTVALLHLNRPELLNLRRALRAIDEHPPKV